MTDDLPGQKIAHRPLHFIWILDTSWSMDGEKIGELNFAIKEALPAMRDVARENVNAELLLRVVTFSNGARWHVAQPTTVEQFTWTDVTAEGVTDMGHAFALVAEQLKMPPMSSRALPPVLVLVTDGYPTDDYEGPLKRLLDEPWGRRAIRLAVGVGGDADHGVLQKFIAHPEFRPLQANNAPTLVKYIRWVSTSVVQLASSPLSRAAGQPDDAAKVPLPAPPPAADGDDVW